MKRHLVVFIALFLIAGCSRTPTAKTQAPSATPTPKPSTYYRETATAIAAEIEGCTDIKAGNVGKGAPDMASTATCSLNGRTVTINSWATPEARDGVKNVFLANKAEAYYAQGDGWTVTPTDDPNLQLQLTNDASALWANAMAGVTPPPADVPGEKASADAAVKSLGGTVIHIKP